MWALVWCTTVSSRRARWVDAQVEQRDSNVVARLRAPRDKYTQSVQVGAGMTALLQAAVKAGKSSLAVMTHHVTRYAALLFPGFE